MLQWAFPLAVIATLFAMLATSRVPLNLYIIRGAAADVVVVGYIAMLAASLVMRASPWLHHFGAPLGVLVFLGRAGGFADLVITDSRLDLLAAVGERVVLTLAVVFWHQWMSFQTGAEKAHRCNNG